VINGQKAHQTLAEMARISIKRHIKIRGDANPHNPNYAEYFQRRNRMRKRVRNTWFDMPATAL
jgi:RNA-directed DNA polymerase